ncbi:MAG TPA: globin domain-containing protein [Saprospiraceae bacterium]|nr:globin domain-containing protein [Saprospiraceae bacterium]
MTDEQILQVKRSWRYFRTLDPFLIGDVFYSKLFLDAPEVKSMFHTSREEQSKKIVDMLSLIVGHLHVLHEVNDDIIQLAKRHVQYGVKAHHYKFVAVALLWTLEQGLGKDWTAKVKDAWTACFTELTDTMIKASGYSSKIA